MARLNISERTSIYQDKNVVFYPWQSLEKRVNINQRLKPINWNKGTYRASLTWLDWGDVNLFNKTKMEKVKKLLSNELTVKKRINFSFNVADWWNILKYYFLMIGLLICIFPSKKGLKKISVLILAYFSFILISNNVFKVFPPRVWMNILNLLVLSSFLILKNNFNSFYVVDKIKMYADKIIQKNKVLNYVSNKTVSIILIILMTFVFMGYSINPIKKISAITKVNYQAYETSLNVLKNLDKDKIYLTDIFMQELYSMPFGQNLLKTDIKIFPMAGFAFFNESKELLAKYGIPETNTIKNIIERDDIYYYSHHSQPYSNFYINNNKLALASFMKETYGEEIAFIPQQKYVIKDVIVYDIIVLTAAQIKRKKELWEEPYYNEIDYIEHINRVK